MFFKSKKLLGLDIGTANIKLAELDVSRTPRLNGFFISPTPSKAINGGEISDPAAVADTIRMMVTNMGTRRKRAAVAMWGTSVITKRISVPNMEEKLIPGQIRWEAEQYIPFDINEVNIDFKVLREYQSSPENLDIMLVAARQDVAYLYQDILQSAGLECAIIDVAGFALANTFLTNWGAQRGQTVALLNIGAALSNFIILENGEVIFCRDIPVGGLTYTAEIHKNMGISMEEAEVMKISACTGQPVPEEVPRIIQSTHEVICEEVQSSLDFFVNTTPGMTVRQCFITGGASRTTGLISAISQSAKLTCDNFDPFRNIRWRSNIHSDYIAEIRDFAAIAIGLGLRVVGDG